MRYIEIMTERDQQTLINSLERMINHPSTPENERENAKRALARIQGTSQHHKMDADDLPNFGEPINTKNKGTHKMGKDDLQDFGTYTAKGTRQAKSTRGAKHDFKV